jgi:proline dehydrogenase
LSILDKIIVKFLPLTPKAIVKKIAGKYIAGVSIEDAMKITTSLNKEGASVTIDVLGEFVESREVALNETEQSIEVLNQISYGNLKAELSVKLTSLGLGIDEEFAYNNLFKVVKRANELGLFVRTDMENSPYTQKTIELQRRIKAVFPDNIGIVLQSYMRRSESDILSLVKDNVNFRLCKGIYNESEDIAFKDRKEIQDNYLKCLKIIFENNCFVGIATHDDVLINGARKMIKEMNYPKEKYQFQMLLGVRENKRKELIEQGHDLQVYVPFGLDWYGYSIRRLKENPEVAGHVFRAMFSKD